VCSSDLEHVATDAFGAAAVSTSASGAIAFRPGERLGRRQFVWFDRTGRQLTTVGEPDDANLGNPALSPDERYLAFNWSPANNADIWIVDLRRGVRDRFTSDPVVDIRPVWSPDGTQIAFSSIRNGRAELYMKPVNGSQREAPIGIPAGDGPSQRTASDWSRDGRYLLYYEGRGGNIDIWAVALDGDRKPFPVVQTKFDERQPQFSPDGRWIAYQSDEPGQFEIYVRPFGRPGRAERISLNGGTQPRWRRDGSEIFFVAGDGQLMAVPIKRGTSTDSLETGAPLPLFATHIGGATIMGADQQQYVVSADGQRFLINTIVEDTTSTPITLVLNWK